MENSVADVELAREGHTAFLADPSYAAPALSAHPLMAMSTSFKVALFLLALTFLLTKDIKTALIIFVAHILLSKML
jgi:hypothetical protein